jgi:hypothetical protein
VLSLRASDRKRIVLHLSENAGLEHKILNVFVTLRSDQLVNRVALTLHHLLD